jgi:hypothetical protein
MVFAKAQATSLHVRAYHWKYHCASCRQLPNIIRLVDNAAFDWLTDLSLDCDYVQDGELYLLPKLRSVVILRIRATRKCAVTDRVIRCWADAAQSDGAFGCLKTLAILYNSRVSKHNALTQVSLDRLGCFPALDELFLYNAPHSIITEVLRPNKGVCCFVRQTPELGVRPLSPALGVCILQVTMGKQAPVKLQRGAHNVEHFVRQDCTKRVATSDNVGEQVDRTANKKRKIRSNRGLTIGDVLREVV